MTRLPLVPASPRSPLPAPSAIPPALDVAGLSRRFGGIVALDNVRLAVRPGEVHCLMGENGAGKSTLLRILAGLLQPDAGEVRVGGQPCRFRSPRDAIARGIAMIHQELMPFPELTVAENIFIGREPRAFFPGTVARRAMDARADALLQALGTPLPPRRLVRDLTVSETQMVEIAKALARHASILIMDEPTSSLSHHETEALFRLIRDLRERGVAVIYVSHKMDEIFRIGQRVTVLRDGRHVATEDLSALDESRLISLMVGRPLFPTAPSREMKPGPVALAVRHLRRSGKYEAVSFEVRRGEILGLAGLMGAGRTEVVSAIYGLAPAEGGEIAVDGRPVRIRRPREAIRHGIGFVSEDRKQLGLVLGAPIQHNLTLGHLRRCCRAGLIRHAREAAVADEAIARYRIRCAGRRQPVGMLSGGNQQKVVIAKVLFPDPGILILDEPTRGIDIGAKQEIYALITGWARAGRAIILVSSELPELLALSDRILVMRAGRITAELPRARFSPEEILRHAMPD